MLQKKHKAFGYKDVLMHLHTEFEPANWEFFFRKNGLNTFKPVQRILLVFYYWINCTICVLDLTNEEQLSDLWKWMTKPLVLYHVLAVGHQWGNDFTWIIVFLIRSIQYSYCLEDIVVDLSRHYVLWWNHVYEPAEGHAYIHDIVYNLSYAHIMGKDKQWRVSFIWFWLNCPLKHQIFCC